MAKTVTMELAAGEAAELQAQIDKAFAEMDRLREEMRRDQAEIERSQMRTEVKLQGLTEFLNTFKRC